MAFSGLLKSIKAIFPGLGHATSYGANLNVSTPVATTAVTIATNSTASNTLSPLSQALSNGAIRVRTNSVGAASTQKVVNITATDGTTTISLYGGDGAATAAGQGLDETIDFVTQLNLNSFTVNIAVTANTSTHDVEVAGNL